MIIITNYQLNYNKKRKLYFLIQKNQSVSICPLCGSSLVYRDSRIRKIRHYGGKRSCLSIRRLKCTGCKKLHNELPDILTAEDYPCHKTMERWNIWIKLNAARKSLLPSSFPLFESLRKQGAGWISAILPIIYNSGGFLSAVF
ncbi:MAG: DUF6431 domain-containing protein [Hungatella sp.]|nr:DUF6431 domain-containing protein [Hungatella sp.]